jgi:hypothetical protein
MKARSVSPDAPLIAQCLAESLPERDAAILNGMMRIHFQVALASEVQIYHSVPRKQAQHVVEEWDSRPHRGLPATIHSQFDSDARFIGRASHLCTALIH